MFACCWLLESQPSSRVVTNIPIKSVVIQQCGVSRQMCDTQKSEQSWQVSQGSFGCPLQRKSSAISCSEINCTAVAKKACFVRLPSQEEKIV